MANTLPVAWLSQALSDLDSTNIELIQMKAIDAVRIALDNGDSDLRFIEDMESDPLAQPFPGGNHPMWIIGHLAVTEARLHQILFDEPNAMEHWKPLFDWGTEPSTDLERYPPISEVLSRYRELRKKTIEYLKSLNDDDLDAPTKCPPPGMEKAFDTVGNSLLTFASHQAFHGGQASVARRSSGRSPFFTPTEELRKF